MSDERLTAEWAEGFEPIHCPSVVMTDASTLVTARDELDGCTFEMPTIDWEKLYATPSSETTQATNG